MRWIAAPFVEPDDADLDAALYQADPRLSPMLRFTGAQHRRDVGVGRFRQPNVFGSGATDYR